VGNSFAVGMIGIFLPGVVERLAIDALGMRRQVIADRRRQVFVGGIGHGGTSLAIQVWADAAGRALMQVKMPSRAAYTAIGTIYWAVPPQSCHVAGL
jgi:hypothetical protein